MDRIYISENDISSILKGSKSAQEKRANQATIYAINCVARYRGWPMGNNKESNEARDRVFDALKKDRLYFSTALGYNDPYDTLLYFDWDQIQKEIYSDLLNLPEFLERMKQKSNKEREVAITLQNLGFDKTWCLQNRFVRDLRDKSERITKQIHDNIKGICFSQNGNSLLMWSHYANNHTGLSLWYDVADLEKAVAYDSEDKPLPDRFKLEPLKYQSDRFNGTAFLRDYLLYMFNRDKRHPSLCNTPHVFPYPDLKKIILTKNDEWAYEQELRLIPRKLDFTSPGPAKYLKIRPKAIVMGAKISDEDRSITMGIAQSLDIMVYQAYTDNIPSYNILFEQAKK